MFILLSFILLVCKYIYVCVCVCVCVYLNTLLLFYFEESILLDQIE